MPLAIEHECLIRKDTGQVLIAQIVDQLSERKEPHVERHFIDNLARKARTLQQTVHRAGFDLRMNSRRGPIAITSQHRLPQLGHRTRPEHFRDQQTARRQGMAQVNERTRQVVDRIEFAERDDEVERPARQGLRKIEQWSGAGLVQSNRHHLAAQTGDQRALALPAQEAKALHDILRHGVKQPARRAGTLLPRRGACPAQAAAMVGEDLRDLRLHLPAVPAVAARRKR